MLLKAEAWHIGLGIGDPTLTLSLERRGNQTLSSSTGHTYSPLCSISLATRPVQPVWWAAPRPAPLSPWKYS